MEQKVQDLDCEAIKVTITSYIIIRKEKSYFYGVNPIEKQCQLVVRTLPRMTCCIAHLVDRNLRITVMSNIVLCSIVEGHKTREKPDGIACNLCRFVLFRFICFLVSGNVQVYHPPCLNQYIIQYPISHPLIQITFVRKWIITTSEQIQPINNC